MVLDEKPSRGSTRATQLGFDQSQTPKETTDVQDDKITPTSDGEKEDTLLYPSGFKLFFILLALALSIFLASLDMVRPITYV